MTRELCSLNNIEEYPSVHLYKITDEGEFHVSVPYKILFDPVIEVTNILNFLQNYLQNKDDLETEMDEFKPIEVKDKLKLVEGLYDLTDQDADTFLSQGM